MGQEAVEPAIAPAIVTRFSERERLVVVGSEAREHRSSRHSWEVVWVLSGIPSEAIWQPLPEGF